jgi:putative ABC transport system permease protein
MDTLLRDLRFGLRILWRSRSLTFLAILTLALGIGVNSAIFTVVNAVLLRPLPVRDSDRLVTIALNSARYNAAGAQPAFDSYVRWREYGRVFESAGAAAAGGGVLEIGGIAHNVRVWRVSATFLTTLGVNPVLGRNFTAQEDRPGAAPVVILSRALWRSAFASDPRVLGATLKLDGVTSSVVGVLPEGFHVDGRPADLYTPIAMSSSSRAWLPVNVYARLKEGATIEQAQAELDALRVRSDGPAQWRPQVWKLRDFQVRDVRLSLWVLLGAVGLVLLIACANTASLLLARAQSRRQEVAVRAALGAGQGRLLRQLLTESTLLSVAGGAAGIGVAALCVRGIPLLMHERLPGLLEQSRIDGAVLVFSLALSVATGLLFGIVPALAISRNDPHEVLKAGCRSGQGAAGARAVRTLIVVETALALMLAIGATLLIRTFFYLRDVAPGFRVDNLLIATVNSDRTKFANPDQCVSYYESLVRSVRAIPGVRAATFAQALPLTGDNWASQWEIEGHVFARPQDAPILWVRHVDEDYFRTLQIPLRRGRLFTERDNRTAMRVAIVNDAFVRRFWPGQDPIGKHIGAGQERTEVVGVVGDVRHQDSTKDAPNELFLPYRQLPTARVAVAIRVDSSVYPQPLRLEPALRRAIATVDSRQAVTKVSEMRQVISDRIASKRLSAQLIAVFAGLAALLALVGIYGVLSFSMAQRTHELGLRMALGADRASLLGMVVRQAVLLAAGGVCIGVAASLALTRVVRTLVFGMSATDPGIYASAAFATVALAVVAAAVPAWRASSVDPVVALRDE